MKKIRWVKQLTRENTLLDRSLRTVAYDRSVREIGRASMSTVLIAGSGAVNSWYYSTEDYARVRTIIAREFRGPAIEKMAHAIVAYLEDGLRWSLAMRRQKISKTEFKDFYSTFNLHHAHARGAIVYGYWGEPTATANVRRIVGGKVKKEALDHTISQLSTPKYVTGILNQLSQLKKSNETNRASLCLKLNVSDKAREAVEILSWFTFFYEYGERVAGHLHETFLEQLRRQSGSAREFENLAWYDPRSLVAYYAGHKLPSAEIKRRQDFYIMEILNSRWRILSGEKARRYFTTLFPQSVKSFDGVKEIKGMTAQPGRASGRVKIVITQADQDKMKKGDILVSPMTTVKMMTAVRKAAAIVTDEGGMTAHAAIVAREFKIPCIVGTKIATTVFKDGDRVEVDADKGVMKKI